MTELYVYGFAECDQFENSNDPDEIEAKTPIPIQIKEPDVKIFKVCCGALHSVALSTKGIVYTWGCGDNGALGRTGIEKLPEKIQSIFHPIFDIAAGETHTIAINPHENVLYLWGFYRDISGMIGQPIKEPIQMNLPLKEEEDKIKKGICGNNHTLVLTEKGFVYAWGNGEFGQTCQNVRREEDPAQMNENTVDPSMRTDHLIPNKLSTRDVDNIFTGGNHSFLIVKKEQRNVLKAWGLNSFGQLGTGDKENTWIPKDVIFNDRDCSVLSATGGSDHSLALTENGKVYAWGRNDENQCGINNDEGTARDDLCFSTPQEINFFSQHNIITDIKSYSHFNYAYNTDNGNVYSWGMGESYVLGNKRDSNEKSPFQIPQTFFNNLKIRDISLGSQHVIVSLYDPVTGVKCPKFEFDIGTGEQMDICENERNSPSLKRKNERDDNDNIGEIQMKGSPSKVKEINNENKKEIPVDIEMKNENDNKNEDKEKEVEEINEENQKDITPVKKSNNKEPKQKSINKKTPIKSRAQSAAKKQTTEKKVTNKKTSAKKTESRRTTNKKSSKHENRQNEEESDDEDEKEEKVKRSVSKRSNSKPKSSNKKYKKDDNDDNEKKTQRNKSKTNMRVVKPRKQKEIVSESESDNESEEEEKPKKREYKKRRNIKSKPKVKTTSKRGKTTSNTKNSKRTKSKKQEEKTSIRKHSKSAKKTTANKKARSKSSKKK